MTMDHPYCRMAPSDPWHGPYHGTEYGVPQDQDSVLFERLVLEINQAGLSWLTVLKKRASFTAAYANWDIDRVADFGAADIERLLADPGIIRNRLKIAAAITNAAKIREIRDSHGSFKAWLDVHHPRDKAAWVKLFKQTFKFTGGEIVGEFLMSLGYLPGAHGEECPRYQAIMALTPPWTETTAR